MAIWIVTLIVLNRFYKKTNKNLMNDLKKLKVDYEKLLQQRLQDTLKSKNPVIKHIEDLFAKIGSAGEVQVIEFRMQDATVMCEFTKIYTQLTYDEFMNVLEKQDDEAIAHLRDLLVKNKVDEKVKILDAYLKHRK